MLSLQPQQSTQSLAQPPKPIPIRRLRKLPNQIIIVLWVTRRVANLLRQGVFVRETVFEECG
jgi:hypothetical protein